MNDMFMQSFPNALRDGDKIEAYARIVAQELAQLHNESNLLALYAKIEELEEPVLDILARDFNVKWYLYDSSLESKRAQIKSCFYIHRHRGTYSAVDTALTDIYAGAKLSEWFEYGGRPGHFKISLGISENGIDVDSEKIFNALEMYKRLSAVLEKVILQKRDEFEIHVGIVMQRSNRYGSSCGLAEDVLYCDQDGNLLTDELGNTFIALLGGNYEA